MSLKRVKSIGNNDFLPEKQKFCCSSKSQRNQWHVKEHKADLQTETQLCAAVGHVCVYACSAAPRRIFLPLTDILPHKRPFCSLNRRTETNYTSRRPREHVKRDCMRRHAAFRASHSQQRRTEILLGLTFIGLKTVKANRVQTLQ